jgi:SAM-dependent methyltransferase
VDISEELLGHCRAQGAAKSGQLEFELADFREPLSVGPFDGVVNLGISFGYYDHEDNVASLRNLAGVLKPGGRFIIENDNIENLQPGWVELAETIPGLGLLVMRRRFNPSNHCFEGEFYIEADDGRRVVLDRARDQDFDECIRVYSLDEMGSMCRDLGLEVVAAYGRLEGSTEAYAADSPRCFVLGQK